MRRFNPPSQPGRPIRVLLTEGTSLSSRQTVYALGYAGAVIDICDPRPLMCLARYSRFVRACYRCPSFTQDPVAYIQFLNDRLRAKSYDVLFPVHDQVYLLSRMREAFADKVGLPVPDFAAVERLQSKAEFVRLLAELSLPHPPTVLVRTRAQLEQAATFPCYVKLPFSTAGRGVWLVGDAAERDDVAHRLEKEGRLAGATEVLVQQPAPGVLGVVQCVFQHGRLVAGHCYLALALGVGGSACARVSVRHPLVLEQVAALGAHLRWHGALTFDYLWDPATGRPAYIDSNPRIGETLNATLSGVNLCAALVQVALGLPASTFVPGRQGLRSHNTLLTLLAKAQRGHPRRSLLAELWQACSHQGAYAGSQDELIRPHDDFLSLLPAAWLTARILLNPRSSERIVNRTVENYALSEEAAQAIRELALLSRPAGSIAEPRNPLSAL
jgi:predicted ATP-grasp superfamily ATP-dependent carboligase